MRSKLIALVILVLGGLLSVGSAARVGASANALRKRASFDLGCPNAKLHWTKIDARTWGVSGCDRRAIYIETCDGPRTNTSTRCTWVMNSRTKR